MTKYFYTQDESQNFKSIVRNVKPYIKYMYINVSYRFHDNRNIREVI